MNMKKIIFYIKLMYGPVSGDSQDEHSTYGGWFDNLDESFLAIDA